MRQAETAREGAPPGRRREEPALDWLYQAHLLQDYGENRIAAAVINWMLLSAMALALAFSAHWHFVTPWLLSAIIVNIGLGQACREFLAANIKGLSSRALPYWSRRLFWWELLANLPPSAILVFALSDEATNVNFLLATIILGFALNTNICARLSNFQLASAAPIFITLILLNLVEPRSYHLPIGLILFGLAAIYVLFGRQARRAALTALQHRAQMDNLVAELQYARTLSNEARRRAEAESFGKSRFLANMSHELRTPLNAIVGFSEVMKDGVLGPIKHPKYQEYAHHIHSSGLHLLELINGILDLSRIEAGRHRLGESSFDLGVLLGECVEMTALDARKKGVDLIRNVAADSRLFRGDPQALRQIILNLLTNAIKFTPGGGRVEARRQTDMRGGQSIIISDNGPGIPESEIKEILQPYARGSLAIKSAEPGTGLGLPIVKALTEMHGGSFKISSRPGAGTRVEVCFLPSRTISNTHDRDAGFQDAGGKHFEDYEAG